MKFVAKIELILIALWLGAACFFSFGVAPSVFSVLPSRELAGSVVNRTLTIINFSGVVIGAILILMSFIPRNDAKKYWIWLQRFFLLMVTAACAAGQLIIGLYLEHLRKLIGRPIDELAANDPLRLQFNLWHQYSVWVLTAGMIAALIAFFVISRMPSGGGTISKSDPVIDFDLPEELKM
jgi:hypothetical protein